MEISLEKYPVFRDRIYKNPDGGIIPNLWCEGGSHFLGNLNPLLVGTIEFNDNPSSHEVKSYGTFEYYSPMRVVVSSTQEYVEHNFQKNS